MSPNKGVGLVETMIPLPLAAAQLRLRWPVAYDLLLTGELQGKQVRGRWRVTVSSVNRVREKLAAGDL